MLTFLKLPNSIIIHSHKNYLHYYVHNCATQPITIRHVKHTTSPHDITADLHNNVGLKFSPIYHHISEPYNLIVSDLILTSPTTNKHSNKIMAATTGDVKLIGAWPSPYVMRPRVALNIKSVEYEFLEEKFGQKSELLLKSNPVYKKIPVLIHQDKPICESLIIVQYVDEFWSSGPSILPSDPYDRATARFWAAYIDDKFFPSLSGIAKAQDEEAKKEAFALVHDGLELLEGAYEKCSKGKTFFGGDKIGYLDIALGSFLGWIRVTEAMNKIKVLDEEKTPGLFKWAEKFVSDEAVKDVMPETEKLIEFAKIIFAKMRPAA